MKNLLVLSTAATAITISCPSASAKMFRMTCTPTDSAPYTVAYDSDAGVSYITSQSGVTRKYHVLDVKDKSNLHVLYVATKAPNQTRKIYLAFDYSGDDRDVSAMRVIDRASDKKDKCAFISTKAALLDARRACDASLRLGFSRIEPTGLPSRCPVCAS
jgi:hypothetical protein